jgi:choline monooxygenase
MHDLTVDADISKAKTIHKSFYTHPDYFEASKHKIFDNCWHFIGDESLVNEERNCHPFILMEQFLAEPLLLTRDKDNQIHCLSNVCTHRGNLILYEDCKSANLRCRYHGRIFKLDGKIISMPEFKEVKNFPSKEDDLSSLPVFKWGKLLFTSLSLKAKPGKYFNDMIARLSWMPVHEFVYRPELSREFIINAHWALYCENYLEGFHIPFVHAGLNAVIDYGSYTTELFKYSSLQLGIAKENEDCFNLPSSSEDYGKSIAAYYFWIFPNMMFNFYPWGLSINIVEPIAIDKTKITFLTYIWKEEKYNKGAGSNLDKVELEDEEVVQNVQKGIRSSFYSHGRYSVTREQGTHHFHRLIAAFMK